jgi:putative ABC transport system permease protein
LEITDAWRGEGYNASFTRPFTETFIASSPHIVTGALTHREEREQNFYVERDDQRHFFSANRMSVTPEFTDVFTFDFIQGSATALEMPDHIIIPQSLAHKVFGNESAVGKQFVFRGFWGDLETRTVGAVYRDFPANSIFANYIYFSTPPEYNRESWGNANFNLFLLVDNASNADLVIDNFKRNFDEVGRFRQQDFSWQEYDGGLRLTALSDIHFTTDVAWDFAPKVSRQTLLILFAIAFVIIIIAAINFTNFSTALAPMRIRNINTQRVMGAQQRTIRWILVIEAIMFSVVSYLVAILLVHFFGGSPLANLISADLSPSANLLIVGATALAAIVVGVAAGLYPSRYMTSFAPALALKGNWGLSPRGKKIRNTLIAIQFVASFVLIIIASFMYLQNRFMQNSDLGFNADAVVTVDINQIQEHRDAVTHQLRQHSWVEDVTYSRMLLSSRDIFSSRGRNYEGEFIQYTMFSVNYNFLQTMGIEVTTGRNFRQEDGVSGAYIFNETARRQYNMRLNTSIDNAEIIGFAPDIHFASFRTAIEPMAFYVNDWERENINNYAYILLSPNTNLHEAMSQIRTTLAEFEPNYPFEIRFFDEVLQQLYEQELRLSSLILIFSLIAILISIVGVFGLVVFDSECRRKEIGIRKVLGSSAMEIVLMFNKAYFRILLICFVVAVPVAWFAVSRWLENFAYRTPMYWWVFALALVAVGIITALTVTIQNWRVANDDPVRSIKTE